MLPVLKALAGALPPGQTVATYLLVGLALGAAMCSEPRGVPAPAASVAATVRPGIVVARTSTATATPQSTAVPTATPTLTATPRPPGPAVDGSDFFKQRTLTAVELLRADPVAYRRYVDNVEKVQQAPPGTLTDSLLNGSAVQRMLRFPGEILTTSLEPLESLRQTAAVLSRESTHVAIARGNRAGLAPAFDAAYLNSAYTNYWLAYRAREQARILDNVERRRAAQSTDCDGRMIEESAKCRVDLDRSLEEGQRLAYEALEASMRQEAATDPASAYLQLFRNRPLTAAQQTEILASACWAQHNELFTYLRLGGRSLEVLRTVLMVNTPTCRTLLGIL